MSETESPATLPAWAIEAARRIRIEVDGLSANDLRGFESELQTIAYIIERERVRASVGVDAAEFNRGLEEAAAVADTWLVAGLDETKPASGLITGQHLTARNIAKTIRARITFVTASPSPAAEIVAESRVAEAREWIARGKRVFRPDIVSDLCNEIDALREAERRIRAAYCIISDS